ncbi:DUF1467 family protein [Prosthecomicrobium sp. N25]|uniref:DUF1467 family protein n=1 Tax=Prosthecomicrobium sp. N25 TaxID=3129254 RepID=UPI00307858E9
MAFGTGLAVYFVIWWLTLFAVLPFGVTSQHETGEITPGSEPGAPAVPRLLVKLFWTTVVSGVIFAGFVAVRQSGLTLEDIPLPGYPGRS